MFFSLELIEKENYTQQLFLKRLGYSVPELLDMFYEKETIHLSGRRNFQQENLTLTSLLGTRADDDIIDPKSGKVLVKKGKKFTKAFY